MASLKHLGALFLGAAAIAWPGNAIAVPTKSVNILYYNVSGKTLLDIYRSLTARGPRLGDKLLFASTAVHTDQLATTLQTTQSCKYAAYQLKLNFTTKLPQLSPASALNPADLARWQSFTAFIQKHEATHRDIWMACATKLESDILALRALNCADLTRQTIKVASATASRCIQQHQAFDVAQRRVLRQQPFMQAIIKQLSN